VFLEFGPRRGALGFLIHNAFATFLAKRSDYGRRAERASLLAAPAGLHVQDTGNLSIAYRVHPVD
jgi:hypothetical protein